VSGCGRCDPKPLPERIIPQRPPGYVHFDQQTNSSIGRAVAEDRDIAFRIYDLATGDEVIISARQHRAGTAKKALDQMMTAETRKQAA